MKTFYQSSFEPDPIGKVSGLIILFQRYLLIETCTIYVKIYVYWTQWTYKSTILKLQIEHCRIIYLRQGLLGQSDAPSDWYSGGRGFDPRVRHHLS